MSKTFTRTVLVLVITLCTSANILAQSLTSLNTDLQKVRVGLVDEFFDRFNGKVAHPDIPLTDANGRRNNLMILLDLSQFKSKEDSIFQEAAKMIDTVIRDSVKINFSDTTWVAIAHCKGVLEGKSVNFDIFLTVQHRKQGMYKWVVSKVDGNFFNITPRVENEKIMLYPDDHETNFMSLGRMTKEQPFNVKNFMAKGFEYDITSVFAYLVYNRKLKIDYVNELEFVFTQIPEYIFHVKYFERENKNSGWLISNFYKSTQEEKATFLGSLYHPHKVEVIPIEKLVKTDSIKSEITIFDASKDIDNRTVFIKRRAEKLSQLVDNINFMQSKDTLRSRYVYQNKTEALFADSVKVYLQYKKKSKNRIVGVSDFCKMLIEGDIKYERIDSVSIPLWDEKVNSLPSDINKVELNSFVLPFEKAKSEILSERPKSVQKLFAYKEETEDGIEWIPIIGDIFVKVK